MLLSRVLTLNFNNTLSVQKSRCFLHFRSPVLNLGSKMAAKRGSTDAACEENSNKKSKSECQDDVPTKLVPETTPKDLKISEITNISITVEWDKAKNYEVSLLENRTGRTFPSATVEDEEENVSSVEFTDLTPLTEYTVTVQENETAPEKAQKLTVRTRPSLEMPEIEDVQEGYMDLTISAVPEEEAENVLGYLLLVRPLEDAKDFPAAAMSDSVLQTELEKLVSPPFYIAYEFSQEELLEDDGGQIRVGSGKKKAEGKYGAVQDPKLTSGGFYRVVLVVIMEVEGKRTLFAEESCRVLIK